MTVTLQIPRVMRHPAWYAPILLPALPFVAAFNAGRRPGDVLGTSVLLLTLGVALALGLPALMDHLGRSIRKEAESLRGAWIASMFFAQLPLLRPEDEYGLGVLFFAATCALIASISFGTEFQQRTLAGLLSQPVTREHWWSVKTRTLAVALTLHWVVFLLSRLTLERGLSPMFVVGSLVAAAIAWGTTPWWTLLTRGLLAGLVFSLAVPMLALTAFSAAVDAWTGADILKLEVSRNDPLWTYALLFVVAPAYALCGARFGRRRWLALEAPDSPASEGGILGLPRLGVRSASPPARGRPFRLILFKELHLQTLTVILALVALSLALVATVTVSNGSTHEMARVTFSLVAGVTILLAGATAIAEERRLGTLDAQLLLPVSRAFQWWIKLGVALLLAGAMAWLLFVTFATPSPNDSGRRSTETFQALAVVLTLFAPALLASSGVNNALRAVIIGVAVSTLIAVGIGFTIDLTTEWAGQASRAVYDSAQGEAELWKSEAASMAPEEIEALPHRAQGWLGPTQRLVSLASLIPAALALVFAWRNFARPMAVNRRLPGQFAACLGLLFVVLAWGSWRVISATRELNRAEWLTAARAIVDLEQRLSPAERDLWSRYRREPYAAMVHVELAPASHSEPRGEHRAFLLPLKEQSRRLLMHRGRIPEPLRDALRQEAQQKGEDLSPPPPETAPIPGTRHPMNPALMRRYGLTPSASANPP